MPAAQRFAILQTVRPETANFTVISSQHNCLM